MGMFDYVDFECECPICGDTVTGFQTKDRDCTLSTVEPDGLSLFYSKCDGCNVWIDYTWEHPVAGHAKLLHTEVPHE